MAAGSTGDRRPGHRPCAPHNHFCWGHTIPRATCALGGVTGSHLVWPRMRWVTTRTCAHSTIVTIIPNTTQRCNMLFPLSRPFAWWHAFKVSPTPTACPLPSGRCLFVPCHSGRHSTTGVRPIAPHSPHAFRPNRVSFQPGYSQDTAEVQPRYGRGTRSGLLQIGGVRLIARWQPRGDPRDADRWQAGRQLEALFGRGDACNI